MTSVKLLDPTTLQNLVDLDDGGSGLLREMIAIFRDDTPRRLRDILAAVASGHAESLSQAAHALKGGAGALGAEALRAAGAELERLGREGSVDAGSDLEERLQALFTATLAALETYAAHLEGR